MPCEMGRTKGGGVKLRWSRARAPLPRSTMTTGQQCGHHSAKRQHEMPERYNPFHATNVEVTTKCDDDGAESNSHDSEPAVSKHETDFQALIGVRGVAEVDSESRHKLLLVCSLSVLVSSGVACS